MADYCGALSARCIVCCPSAALAAAHSAGWGRPGPTGRIAYTAGTFSIGDRTIACKHVLMLAGGTGITPMAQARTHRVVCHVVQGCICAPLRAACGIIALHAAL